MDTGTPCGEVKSNSSSKGLVNVVDDNLGKFLDTQDSCGWNTSDRDDVSNIKEVFEGLKLEEGEAKSSQKVLWKCPTFPSTMKVSSSAASDEQVEDEGLETALQQMSSDESATLTYSRSISLPSPLKLVSAMKGSRERQGGSPRKLTVKWAPDVYDPPPTIVSHTVNRGRKQKFKKDDRNRQKNGKKGQKGNSSRGGGKDKKQFRKNVGIIDKGYKALDARNRVIELSDDLKDFEVGGRDSYCGTSFLKESLSNVHFSVAEAL